jgi:hypothetical protein
VNHRGSGVFRGSLPDIAGSVPQTRGTAPVAVIASFGGRVEVTAQFHQNSRSCNARRPATDTAVVDRTSTANVDPDQHGEGSDHAVSRILKPAHHPRPTRHRPGLRQTSAGVNVTLGTLQSEVAPKFVELRWRPDGYQAVLMPSSCPTSLTVFTDLSFEAAAGRAGAVDVDWGNYLPGSDHLGGGQGPQLTVRRAMLGLDERASSA